MTTTMEHRVLNIENKTENKQLNDNFSIERLSAQQLIDLAVDSNDDKQIEIKSCQELVKRGKDNIQARIVIKKHCKKTISSLEALLDTINTEDDNEEVIKAFKNKFLTSVSMLDKLQLEWQKHDLTFIN